MKKKYSKIHLAVLAKTPHTICEISYDTYSQLHKINQRLEAYRKAQRPFRIVEKNFAETTQLQAFHNKAIETKRGYSSIELDDMYIDFNRVLLNYLSSVRFFQDFSEGLLKRWFGSLSSKLKQYKTFLESLYDSHLEYRFMYGFRNYVQHYELPVDALEFSISVRMVDNRPVQIYISKESLMANKDRWNKKVLSDIATLPDRIEFLPLVAKYHNLLREASLQFTAILRTIVNEFQTDFEELMKPFENVPGAPAILLERRDDRSKIDYEYILFDVYRSMQNANGS
jgi:hypothetical protein